MKSTGRWLAALLCWLALTVPAFAHSLDASLIVVDLQPDQVHVSVQVNIADILSRFAVDADGNQRISPAEIDAALPRNYEFFESAIGLMADGTALALKRPDGALTQRITTVGSEPMLAHELHASAH